MPIGYLLLLVVTFLVLFGAAQRVLDRMRLTDRQALLIVGAIFIGSLIPNIPLGKRWSINIGGALVPLGVCVYLLIKAGTARERLRALGAMLLSTGAVLAISYLMPAEPEAIVFDPNYLYGVAAGVIACILGRSRRSAFIGGTLGVLLADVIQGIINHARGFDTAVNLGGAGALDAVVLSGVLAVLISEGVGEIRERLQGGSDKHGKYEFKEGEFQPIKEEKRHE